MGPIQIGSVIWSHDVLLESSFMFLEMIGFPWTILDLCFVVECLLCCVESPSLLCPSACDTGCSACTASGMVVPTGCQVCDEGSGYLLDLAGNLCVNSCGAGEFKKTGSGPHQCTGRKLRSTGHASHPSIVGFHLRDGQVNPANSLFGCSLTISLV